MVTGDFLQVPSQGSQQPESIFDEKSKGVGPTARTPQAAGPVDIFPLGLDTPYETLQEILKPHSADDLRDLFETLKIQIKDDPELAPLADKISKLSAGKPWLNNPNFCWKDQAKSKDHPLTEGDAKARFEITHTIFDMVNTIGKREGHVEAKWSEHGSPGPKHDLDVTFGLNSNLSYSISDFAAQGIKSTLATALFHGLLGAPPNEFFDVTFYPPHISSYFPHQLTDSGAKQLYSLSFLQCLFIKAARYLPEKDKELRERYMQPIRQELINAGMSDQVETFNAIWEDACSYEKALERVESHYSSKGVPKELVDARLDGKTSKLMMDKAKEIDSCKPEETAKKEKLFAELVRMSGYLRREGYVLPGSYFQVVEAAGGQKDQADTRKFQDILDRTDDIELRKFEIFLEFGTSEEPVRLPETKLHQIQLVAESALEVAHYHEEKDLVKASKAAVRGLMPFSKLSDTNAPLKAEVDNLNKDMDVYKARRYDEIDRDFFARTVCRNVFSIQEKSIKSAIPDLPFEIFKKLDVGSFVAAVRSQLPADVQNRPLFQQKELLAGIELPLNHKFKNIDEKLQVYRQIRGNFSSAMTEIPHAEETLNTWLSNMDANGERNLRAFSSPAITAETLAQKISDNLCAEFGLKDFKELPIKMKPNSLLLPLNRMAADASPGEMYETCRKQVLDEFAALKEARMEQVNTLAKTQFDKAHEIVDSDTLINSQERCNAFLDQVETVADIFNKPLQVAQEMPLALLQSPTEKQRASVFISSTESRRASMRRGSLISQTLRNVAQFRFARDERVQQSVLNLFKKEPLPKRDYDTVLGNFFGYNGICLVQGLKNQDFAKPSPMANLSIPKGKQNVIIEESPQDASIDLARIFTPQEHEIAFK